MVIFSTYFLLLLLTSNAYSAPLNRDELAEYYDYEDSSEDFVEKDSCTILVRIDSSPSSFFSLLPNYLTEVSSVLNRTVTVLSIDGNEQIFVGLNESRKIITHENSSSSDSPFVDVLLETDLSECFNEDNLIHSIDQARQTFSSISVISSPLVVPTDHQSSASSYTQIVKIVIGISICFAFVIVLLCVLNQTRRSPKKRTHTVYTSDIYYPDYDTIRDVMPLRSLSSSPAAKNPPPPPPSFPPPLPTPTTDQSSTDLHHLASGTGPIEITDSNRWMVNYRDEYGRTPLHNLAASPIEEKCASQVEADALLLIENGANVNEQDKDGNTPLHLSISHLRPTLSKILLRDTNIDVTIVNRKEQTPLHIAAQVDDFIILEHLLAASNAIKTLNMTDHRNFTPLIVSIRNSSQVNFARRLLAAGANPEYPGDKVFDEFENDKCHGDRTAFHYAAQLGMNEHVKILTQHGANVNAHDSRRRSPLHYAVENGKMSTIRLLVSIGGDIGIHDHRDQTPLDLARELGLLEAVTFLESEAKRNRETANTKKRRRGRKEESDTKRRRSSTDTGYKSGSPIVDLEEERGEIVDTPSRVFQHRSNSQLFLQSNTTDSGYFQSSPYLPHIPSVSSSQNPHSNNLNDNNDGTRNNQLHQYKNTSL